MVRKKKKIADRPDIFPFLDLPPELRDIIYWCSFAAYDTVLIRRYDAEEDGLTKRELKGEIVLQDAGGGQDSQNEHCLKQHGTVNLIRVCKEICDEARSIL